VPTDRRTIVDVLRRLAIHYKVGALKWQKILR
jgi:hypothetical protein